MLGSSLLACIALAFLVPAAAAEITANRTGHLVLTTFLFLLNAGVGISLLVEILTRSRTFRK